MPAESAADRAAFFNPDDFGASATYTAAGGGPVTIDGLFLEPSASSFAGAGGGIASSNPSFRCRSADLPAEAAVDDEIAIGSRTFRVATVEPDGTGLTELQLEEI